MTVLLALDSLILCGYVALIVALVRLYLQQRKILASMKVVKP